MVCFHGARAPYVRQSSAIALVLLAGYDASMMGGNTVGSQADTPNVNLAGAGDTGADCSSLGTAIGDDDSTAVSRAAAAERAAEAGCVVN